MANEDAIYIGELSLPMLKGDKGDTGAQGPQGVPGIQGVAGQSATVAVGTVQTGAAGTPAIITNSGTASNVVLNFTIPKGDKGDTPVIPEASETENGLMSSTDKAFINDLQEELEEDAEIMELLDEINGESITLDSVIDLINGEEIV